jgi:predicted RNA-binding Zn-ribbon protein involved in translation (DUF1610 family)
MLGGGVHRFDVLNITQFSHLNMFNAATQQCIFCISSGVNLRLSSHIGRYFCVDCGKALKINGACKPGWLENGQNVAGSHANMGWMLSSKHPKTAGDRWNQQVKGVFQSVFKGVTLCRSFALMR